MKTQLRPLIAAALYPTKAHILPSVCERYGLEPGTGEEAFSSKMSYVMRRLEKLSDEQVLIIAKAVVTDFPVDKLQSAIEALESDGHLVSDVTRHNLAEVLSAFSLGGNTGR
jgi:hypothetical protein